MLIKAQKYSTQSGYEKYFVENYKQLDKIEGIWKQSLQATLAGSNQPVGNEAKSTVAIIFERNDYAGNKIFAAYTLENGRYDPTSAVSQYLKFTNNSSKYIYNGAKNAESGISFSSSPFYYGNITDKIAYTFSVTDKSDRSSATIIIEVKLYKAFPFEGDIPK